MFLDLPDVGLRTCGILTCTLNARTLQLASFARKSSPQSLLSFPCFGQAFLSYAKAGLGPAEWLANHEDVWPLVLPKAATQKVLSLGLDGSWMDVGEELAEITSSSSLGMQLFGFASKQVAGLRIDKLVESHVEKAMSRGAITQSVLAEVRNTAMLELSKVAETEALKDRRQVTIFYRGCGITAKVSCVAEHFDCALQAALRSAAASAGSIPCLPAEKQLCEGSPGHAGTKIDASLLKHAKASRNMALGLAKADDCKNGEALKACPKPCTLNPCKPRA